MGQNQGKSKVQRITTSVEEIRGSLRRTNKSRIDTQTKQQLQGALINYSQELSKLGKSARRREIDEAQKLISQVTKELQTLENDNVSTNSNEPLGSDKKKSPPHQEIIKSVENIRVRLQNGDIKEEEYDKIQRNLARFSKQLAQSAKKSKRAEIEATQKRISILTREIISLNRSSGSVETDSFKHIDVTPNPKRFSLKSRREPPSIDQIDSKLKSVKNDVNVAINNHDTAQLHFSMKTIETLMSDLDFVQVSDRKVNLEKDLIRTYHKIDKDRKNISRDTNIDIISKLQAREKAQRSLEHIRESLTSGVPVGNFQVAREKLSEYRTSLDSVDDHESELLRTQKTEIAKSIAEQEFAITKVEINAKLQQAEATLQGFYKNQLEGFRFGRDSDNYVKSKNYLNELKEYGNKISGVDEETTNRRNNFLAKLDEISLYLDQKVNEGEVTIRRTGPNLETLNGVVETLTSFDLSGTYSPEDKKSIVEVLNKIRSVVDLRVNQLSSGGEAPIKVVAKLETLPKVISINNKNSEVVRIEGEIRQIEQKLRENDNLDYQSLLGKLDFERDNLKRHSGHNVSTLVQDIDKLVTQLQGKIITTTNNDNRRSTTEDILAEIMLVSTTIHDLGQQINSVTPSKDIESKLLDYDSYLRKMDMTKYSQNIAKSREEVLNQIGSHLKHLKSAQDEKSKGEMEFYGRVRNLKDKVARFTGTYKNVLYVKLEDDLKKCSMDVGRLIGDPIAAHKIRVDVDANLRILEQKSVKDRHYHMMGENNATKLNKIRKDVEDIKDEINQNDNLTQGQIEGLEDRLTVASLSLDDLPLGQESELVDERTAMYKEIQDYLSYIKQIPKAAASRILYENIAQQQEDINNQFSPQEEILRIEQEIARVLNDATSFIGQETDPKFFEIDETIIRNTMKLDSLKQLLQPGTDLFNRKIKLMKDMESCNQILDARVRLCEEIDEIEKKVREMSIKIELFSGHYKDPDYNILDEQLIELRLKIGKLVAGNGTLGKRRADCMRKVDLFMRKLDSMAKSRGAGNFNSEGTLV